MISAAFEELTVLLKGLESSEAEIQNVTLADQYPDTADEITAELTVSVPVFAGVSLQDEVTIEAENMDVQNRRISVDLSVTIPVNTENASQPVSGHRTSTSQLLADSQSRENSVQVYKDPDALQAVYEEYDTFPEMTEALGTDVTSETVRRYMVEYDIHDPTDNTPQSHSFSQTVSQSQTDSEGDDHDASDAVSESLQPSNLDETTDGGYVDTQSSRTSAVDRENDMSDVESSALGSQSLAELIAEKEGEPADDKVVADGLGITPNLTIAEFADIINRSNTIHEVKQQLDMSQSNTRRLLRELNLIDIVTNRLAANQINVSHAEIARRIDPENH